MIRRFVTSPWRPLLGGGPVFVVALALAGSTPVTSGCSTPDPNAQTTLAMPDMTAFVGTPTSVGSVSGFLEARCGTLDCHGQPGRPLRIYSGNGLRLANTAGNYSGSSGTTQDERIANYRTVIGLQPEEMSAVVASHGANVANLFLITKPLGRVQHKGGAVLTSISDDGEVCMTSWIQGNADLPACSRASNIRAQ